MDSLVPTYKNLSRKMRFSGSYLTTFLLVYFFPTNLWADFHQKLYSSILAPFKSNKKNCKSFAAFVLEETWEITCFLVFLISCLLTSIILRIPLQRLGRFSCCSSKRRRISSKIFKHWSFFGYIALLLRKFKKTVFLTKKTERKQYIHCVNMTNFIMF